MKLDKSRRDFVRMAGLGVLGSSLVSASMPAPQNQCSQTPRQELGPYPAMKFRGQADHDTDLTHLSGQEGTATGDIIVVKGRVLDAGCQPVEGAIVEIWQANHFGLYRHEYGDNGKSDPNFQGWGQSITNTRGEYLFKTIVPGLYGRRARHIHYKVSKRGYHEIITQLYFEGDERIKTDGILNSFTHNEQIKVIGRMNKSTNIPSMTFDISLQKVIEGMVPAKVLEEYVGKYELQYKGTYYEHILNDLLGGPYGKAIMTVENVGELLYFTFTAAPRAEIFWKEKDHFDSSAFYDTKLIFRRDANGKVNEASFIFLNGKEMKAFKI